MKTATLDVKLKIDIAGEETGRSQSIATLINSAAKHYCAWCPLRSPWLCEDRNSCYRNSNEIHNGAMIIQVAQAPS
jgi:hypothetical protein